MKPTILIIEDDETMRLTLVDVFAKQAYHALVATTGEEGLAVLKERVVDLVLLDYRLPDQDGLSVLQKIKEIDDDLLVIIMTAYPEVETAVSAMKAGAYDYINKPFDLEELKFLLRRALETRNLKSELLGLRYQRQREPQSGQICGNSHELQKVREMIQKVSQTPDTFVLIQGESGTGKELAANAIHYQSKRRDKPLIKINCSAIPETLLEAELFGYEKGAYTDAKKSKRGLFELAHGGTLLLDEVGSMSLTLQPKLLRALEDKTFRRVGGTKNIKVDVRIIAATNRDLATLIKEKVFREDLYYRMKVVALNMPPLRAISEDIIPLANLFVDENNRNLGNNVKGLSSEAQRLLQKYPWPGNVRELKNAIERAVILSNDDTITPEHLPKELLQVSEGRDESPPFLPSEEMDLSLESMEKQHILRVLKQLHGNKSEAARRLKISRSTLREKMKKCGIYQ